MEATREMIGELFELLRQTKMDNVSARNTVIRTHKAQDNREMVSWLKANKEATVHEILEKSREIARRATE